MEIRTIGIDLGKTVFHLVAVDARGKVVARKKCSRTQLLRFTSNLPSCLIGMEACAGSHLLGRGFVESRSVSAAPGDTSSGSLMACT